MKRMIAFLLAALLLLSLCACGKKGNSKKENTAEWVGELGEYCSDHSLIHGRYPYSFLRFPGNDPDYEIPKYGNHWVLVTFADGENPDDYEGKRVRIVGQPEAVENYYNSSSHMLFATDDEYLLLAKIVEVYD